MANIFKSKPEKEKDVSKTPNIKSEIKSPDTYGFIEEVFEMPSRAPIDVVCVVDVSGSMSGEKLDLVKNSLRFIMKILG
jgi:Mg-chelatase subunit ChlD